MAKRLVGRGKEAAVRPGERGGDRLAPPLAAGEIREGPTVGEAALPGDEAGSGPAAGGGRVPFDHRVERRGSRAPW